MKTELTSVSKAAFLLGRPMGCTNLLVKFSANEGGMPIWLGLGSTPLGLHVGDDGQWTREDQLHRKGRGLSLLFNLFFTCYFWILQCQSILSDVAPQKNTVR